MFRLSTIASRRTTAAATRASAFASDRNATDKSTLPTPLAPPTPLPTLAPPPPVVVAA
jgi:hypothetical protein